LERVREFNISMCGYGTAACLNLCGQRIGSGDHRTGKISDQRDVTKDLDAVAWGYAGILFKGLKESPQVRLARETVENYVKRGEVPHLKTIPPEMKGKAGVFVSLHKGDELRGCIGTIEPDESNIAQEIIRNAVQSSTQDPRFSPVTPEELPELIYSVDVLTEPEPVKSEKDLDPKNTAPIVGAGWRRGLLLLTLKGWIR